MRLAVRILIIIIVNNPWPRRYNSSQTGKGGSRSIGVCKGRKQSRSKMPGMIQADRSSPLNSQYSSNVSPPLQSFSELSLDSIRSAISVQASSPNPWLQELKSEERGLRLIQLLVACANSVSMGNMDQTNGFLEQIAVLASLTGDPMQRVATYFMKGLATRITKSWWPGLHEALNSTQLPSVAEFSAARQVFFDHFPYLKFAFGAVNLAILDAMEGEKVVHIIDLDASEPAQWIPLLQYLSSRDGGPPHLKISGINERKETLDQTALKLTEEAERLDIPFQFNPIVSKLDALTDDMLRVKTGEAVAVSSVLQLHSLLAPEDACDRAAARSPYAVQARRGGSPQVSVDESHPHHQKASGSSNCSPNRFGQIRGPTGGLLDDRGVKRPRETHIRDDDLLRSMFNGGSNIMSDRTLGEFLEKERSESSSSGTAHPPPPLHHHLHNGINLSRTSNVMSPSEIEAAISRRSSSVMVDRSPSPESAQPNAGGTVDRFLRRLRALSPKVVVVVEQESNHNGATLIERFIEALHYYGSVFDSLESTLPQQCIERVMLEKHLFGRQIQNIVACEGLERSERHEKLERWIKRFDRAGFAPLPFGYPTVMHSKRLVHSYSCDAYRVVEDKGCLTIWWQERPLYSVSAWQS